MLGDDHRRPQGRGRLRIGILVLLSSLGVGHQNGRGAADGQFAEAAGPRPADGQVGVLQQPRQFIAEGPLHHPLQPHLARLRIVAAGEMDHPAARRHQLRQQGPHHAVQAQRPLAAPHGQHQGARAAGDPIR